MEKLYKNKEWLYQKYITEEDNIVQMAEIANVNSTTIRNWLMYYGIKLRNGSEAWTKRAREKASKNNSHFWRNKKRPANIGQAVSANKKGKSYEEIHGPILAKRLKEERRANIKKNPQLIAQMHTPEAEAKMQNTLLNKMKTDPEYRNNAIAALEKFRQDNPNFDKEHSKWLKNYYVEHPEERAARSRDRLNQVMPTKDTDIEVIVQSQLNIAQLAYRKHEKILGQPDIFFPPHDNHYKGLAIFLDGCAWHPCPIHLQRGLNNFDDKKKTERDKFVTNTLFKEGYYVMRIWEHDIMQKDFSIVEYIKDVIPIEYYKIKNG